MTQTEINVRVSCYAGYRGEETPQHFFLNERKIAVVEVIDRWLAPDHRYFKLRGDDGDTYLLRHDISGGYWQLILYEHGRGSDR